MTKRELTAAVVLVAILASRGVLSWQGQLAAFTGAVMVVAAAWAWMAQEGDALRSRIAGAATAALFLGLGVAVVAAVLRAPALVFVAAAVPAALGGIAWRRLRGAPLGDAEPRGRVTFEGRVYALDGGPTTGELLWVARRGLRQRWTSTNRVEVRGEHGKVWIDPRGARAVGPSSRYAGRAAEDAVELARGARARWWTFAETNPMFVVGTARQESDTRVAALRDPPRVTVFADDVVIGWGGLAIARRRARHRTLLWGAIAIAAAGMAAADGLGWLT